MKRKSLIFFLMLALGTPWAAKAQTTLNISSQANWDTFASNPGNYTTVNLNTNDVTVTNSNMVGSSNNPFSGTFNGNGHTLNVSISGSTNGVAPFQYINNATIQNLVVSGSVTQSGSDKPHAAGLVGFASGTNTIENCVVSTNVTNTGGGNSHIGGIVGHGQSSTINIVGCVYNGSLSSSNHIGGLLGWSDSGISLTITNSIFAGTATGSKFHPIAFRNGSNQCTGTFINCYYTADPTYTNVTYNNLFGQGEYQTLYGILYKKAYTVEGGTNVSVALTGTTSYTYNVSRITGYSTYVNSSSTNSGIIYDGKVYAGYSDELSLLLSWTAQSGYQLTGYTASNGTLSSGTHTGSEDAYTLTMPSSLNSGITITATTEEAPDPDVQVVGGASMTWSQFASSVLNGTNYSGQTVKLLHDVTVTEPIGIQAAASSDHQNYFFAGTFDGQGHKVNLVMTTTKDMYGLFAVLNNGMTVQNLIIDGSIENSSYTQVGGLAGCSLGTSTVINCISKVCITSSNTSDVGGFVGTANNGSFVTFEGCAFTGTISRTNTNAKCGGFFGFHPRASWNGSTGSLTFNNCVFDPTAFPTGSNTATLSCVTSDSYHSFSNNNYYRTTCSTNQGKQAYSVTYDTDRNVTVAMSGSETDYSTSGIKAYKNGDTQLSGLVYNGTIIAGNGDQVSLTLTGGGGANLNRFYAIPSGTNLNTSTGKLTMPAANVWITNARRFAFVGFWNEESSWSPNGLPEPDEDVIIESYVYIDHNYVAKIHNIEISGSGSISINEGSQLQHCNEGVVATMGKSIVGYGASTGRDHFYMMALPFTSFDIADSPLVTSGAYDLYKFNGLQPQAEWVNYEQSNTPFTDIRNGEGFLYANTNNSDPLMYLTGTLVPSNQSKSFPLAFNTNTPFGAWKLVGNPFACNATSSITDYYVIGGQNNDEVMSSSGVIQPMQGIFVKATGSNQSVTFTPTTENSNNNNNSSVNLMLKSADTRDAKVIDRARVRFNEGEGLEKFQLNPSHTKIYIPQNGMDYAVVHAQAEGELPVNFKAENNGRYTLSVDIEKVSFDYLHLIDNMTGADVDLLATPTYTFNARTTDYASRFKLVFAATGIEENGPSTGSGTEDATTFAYNNGSEWVIANPSTGSGAATLQVIDVMGRILNSETISGSCSKAINVATGVYMLRLINGNDVKVQKIVVR